MTVQQEQLVDAFSDCVGREKAEEVITTICSDVEFEDTTTFDVDEAVEIAAEVANQRDATPFVRTAASTLQTRIRTGNL